MVTIISSQYSFCLPLLLKKEEASALIALTLFQLSLLLQHLSRDFSSWRAAERFQHERRHDPILFELLSSAQLNNILVGFFQLVFEFALVFFLPFLKYRFHA